jgi:lysylphosphatidylglycerol synthetase-like protein (DUF2156 family)
LFFLNAVIWLLFGVYTLANMAGRYPGQSMTVWIVGILMLGNCAAMLLCGVGLGKHQKRFFYLALVVLAVNIVLTVTDEFGIFDLITLLIDLALLGLLIATRNEHFHPSDRAR